jgi:hypothetical protein
MDTHSTIAPRNQRPRSPRGIRNTRRQRRAAGLLVGGLLALTLAACDGDGHTLAEAPTRSGTTGAGRSPAFNAEPRPLGLVQAAVAPEPLLQLPAQGTPVTVKGLVHGGLQVTVNAERLADGTIAFIDSSQPGADRVTGKGLSVVYEGARLAKLDDLPGPVATMREGETPDIDVLSAAWAAKATLDYFRTEHGRASYDDKGAPLLTIVHIPQDVAGCTHYVTGGQSIASGPCTQDGKKILQTGFDVGMGAESFAYSALLTETPDLFDSSSVGPALLLGTSDYFGTVIQNRALGTPSSTLGGTRCLGEVESEWCIRFADGTVGDRPMDSGVILDDGAFVLREPRGQLDVNQHYGERFDNSLIWSNALWQIRKAFASEDGGDLVASPAAARFDAIVYRAATVLLPNDADLSVAAAAVLQAAVDLRATPAEQAVIQQQFLVSQLCTGCNVPPGAQQAVATTPTIESFPAVVNGGIVYKAELSSGDAPRRSVTMFAPGGDPARAVSFTPAGTSDQYTAAAGDWILQTRYDITTGKWLGIFLRRAGGASEERLDDFVSWATPAISADTVAWSARVDESWILKARSTSGGLVATTKLASLPIHIGVDGSLVAYQLQDGTVGTWDLQTGTTKVLATEPGMPDVVRSRGSRIPGAIAVAGTRVAVLTPATFYNAPYTLDVFDTTAGTRSVITKAALPAGLAMDRAMVVWSEVVGKQSSAAAAVAGSPRDDADLMSYSFATNTFSVLLKARGQQGFPSLGGGQLAWQDSGSLGDDIYRAALPAAGR